MTHQIIDMDHYKRKAHFEHFNTLAYPYVGVSVNVDITSVLEITKSKGLPFFLTLCHLVAKAANAVPEFK